LASNLAEEARRLLSDPDRQEIMRRELKSLKEQLGPQGALNRAAGEILRFYTTGRLTPAAPFVKIGPRQD